MIRALVAKELREHGVVLGLFAVLEAALSILMVVAATRGPSRGVSFFEPLRGFVWLHALLAAPFLCHLLFTREYTGKTQLFLETLPVSRARVIALKLALGALLLGLFTCPTAMALIARGLVSHASSPRLVGLMSLRATCFLFLAYGLCFCVSLLGRYRLPCAITLLLSLGMLESLTEIDVAMVGPLALMDERFATEAETFPGEDVAWTLGLAGALYLLGMSLALRREGSTAALLAQGMSQREKVFLWVALVAFVVAMATLEERKAKAPYDLGEAVAVQREGVVVKVRPQGVADADACRVLAERLAGELQCLRAFLDIGKLPPLMVTIRRDMDGGRYERATLDDAEGVLVRINFPSSAFDTDAFLAWVVPEILSARSHARVELEPNRWVLDGFGTFWAHRFTASCRLGDGDEVLLLRALYGTAGSIRRVDLDDWLRFRDQHGDAVARAVAYSGLKVLYLEKGAAGFQSFARDVLGRPFPRDVRSVVEELRHPLGQRLERATGMSYVALLSSWQRALQAELPAHASRLASIPRLHGEVRVLRPSASERRLSYRIALVPEPGPSARARLVHAELPTFDGEIEPSSMRSEDVPAADAQLFREVAAPYAAGTRVGTTFAATPEALGCEVISGWQRQDLE